MADQNSRIIPPFSSSESNKTSSCSRPESSDDLQTQTRVQIMAVHGSCLAPVKHNKDAIDSADQALQKDSDSLPGVRERLKRHREDAAGRGVLIPDRWGQEELLKDWIDYSSFDALLAPNGIASARRALIADGRQAAGSQRLRIESRC